MRCDDGVEIKLIQEISLTKASYSVLNFKCEQAWQILIKNHSENSLKLNFITKIFLFFTLCVCRSWRRTDDNGSARKDYGECTDNLRYQEQSLGWINWWWGENLIFLLFELTDVHAFYCGVGLKKGKFDESNKDLKCYTFCVAQMSGTLSKKNEVSAQKMQSQMDSLLPDELREHAKAIMDTCISTQKGIPDKCDRLFKFTHCMYDLDPNKFLFP